MFHFCNLAKAIGDENRVRILMALQNFPLCVCQLTALLDLAPSTTSKHLSILRQAQLIECVKNGRWAYYQLPATPANASIATALLWVQESLQNNAKVAEDNTRLREILEHEKGAHCHEGAQYSEEYSADIHSLAEEALSTNSILKDSE